MSCSLFTEYPRKLYNLITYGEHLKRVHFHKASPKSVMGRDSIRCSGVDHIQKHLDGTLVVRTVLTLEPDVLPLDRKSVV